MKYLLASIILMITGLDLCYSQDLRYKPINPAFGGDTFNYQWLLSSAQAQNNFETTRGFSNNPLQDFEANLNRQILNELSRRLISQLFGEGSIEDGSFDFGSLQVSITSQLDGINIVITNNSDGSKTNITVPYQF